MAHVGHELGLQPRRLESPLVRYGQLVLNALALGDALRRAEHPDRRPVVSRDHRAAAVDDTFAAVRADQTVVEGVGLAAGISGLDRRLYPGAVAGMHEHDDSAATPPNRLVQTPLDVEASITQRRAGPFL